MPKRLKCSLLTNTKITKAAYEQANELVNAAQQKSNSKLRHDTDQYVDDVLNDVEHRLDCYLEKFVRTEVISIITD